MKLNKLIGLFVFVLFFGCSIFENEPEIIKLHDTTYVYIEVIPPESFVIAASAFAEWIGNGYEITWFYTVVKIDTLPVDSVWVIGYLFDGGYTETVEETRHYVDKKHWVSHESESDNFSSETIYENYIDLRWGVVVVSTSPPLPSLILEKIYEAK